MNRAVRTVPLALMERRLRVVNRVLDQERTTPAAVAGLAEMTRLAAAVAVQQSDRTDRSHRAADVEDYRAEAHNRSRSSKYCGYVLAVHPGSAI
jgi:hypothetical protein